ncbi:MAG: acyltransferase [Aliarcobacter cryaerophilus]|nr:acyltransferase [Aliarcobacter cryaerophilus]
MLTKLKKSIFIKKVYYKLLYLLKKQKYKNIGKKTYIDKSVHIIGLKNIRIGSNNIISDDTWLNVNDRTDGKIGIEIGNNCYIGKRNFFNSSAKITLKDYFMSGINCSLLGSDHLIDEPLKPYIHTGTTNDTSIYIGTNVWFGANVTVIGDVKIGHGSIIGANSLVLKDIPPFSIAVGNPAKVIKRYNFENKKWTTEFENLTNFMSEDEYKVELKQYDGNSLPLLASGKNFGDLY